MITVFKWWLAVVSTACVLLTGCNRHGTAQPEDDAQVEVGISRSGGMATEAEPGHLALELVKIHENQKALDQAPWFADGGDWTFLECDVTGAPGTHVLIGTRMRGAPAGDVPMSWGEAMITVTDAAAGARFIEIFGKAFQQTPPPVRENNPALRVKMNTAVLGTGQVRNPHGGFKSGPKGTWVATKWFLPDETAEAEVYFNYSISEKRAEFSEKDEEYREDLLQQLAVGLRDGPLPDRTPANDPSLTATGPTVTNWIKVATSNEICQFSPDSQTLFITTMEPGKNPELQVAPVANPTKRMRWAEFKGSVFIQSQVPTPQGITLLITELLAQKAGTFSSLDPQKLWLVGSTGKLEVLGPPGVTNWFATKSSLSPAGHFLALGAWEKQRGQPPARVIHLANLQTGTWQPIKLPATVLELVGWFGPQPTGLVLTGLGARPDEVRKAYALDPTTGQLTPLAKIPPELVPDCRRSPNGRHSARVIGQERLEISDLHTGQLREFAFHPYDRRNVRPDSVQWATDRYLIFQGARTALINADTLKMNYPTTQESGIEVAEFSGDFKLALGTNIDGHYLGSLSLPDATGGNN